MRENIAVIALVITYVHCHAILRRPEETIPSYLKTCRKNDPNLNDCVRESLENLLPVLKNGIVELEVPAIDPLTVSELNLDLGNGEVNLHMTMTEAIVRGLSQTQVISVKTNVEDGKLEISTRTPHLDLRGRYVAEGGVRSLPLSGEGIFNVSMVDVTSAWMVYYREVEFPITREMGVMFPQRDEGINRTAAAGLGMEVEAFALNVMPSKVSYYFDHFLDGDNGLGEGD